MPKVNWTKSKLDQIISDERRRQNMREYRKKNASKTQTYTVRVYKGSEIMQAIEKAAADAGKQPGRYLRSALMEKLQRDGYITEIPDDKEEPEEE